MTSRTKALLAGAIVVIAYLTGAVLSASLSPFARRPLLDGLAPGVPYRWVDPPPALAATNLPPTPGRFTLALGPGGTEGAAFSTPDAQVTIIMPAEAFSPSEDQRSVTIAVTPIDATTLEAPRRSLLVLGNAVLIEARYEPGGDPIERPRKRIDVVLSYPAVVNDGGDHTLLASPNGRRWAKILTTDHPNASQVIGRLHAFGYTVVTGRRLAGVPGGSSQGVPLAAIVVGALLALILVLSALRARRGSRVPERGEGNS